MNAIKKILRFTIFMSILIYLLSYTSKIFTPTWISSDNKSGQIYTIKGFYKEKKNSLDLIFIGDSNLYKGVSPLRLWEDYGIASYSYGISSARIYTMYYLMQDALKHQQPKVIIMDTATLFYKNKEVEPERRKSFDYLPFSKIKLNAINDSVFANDITEKLSYIFPIFRYHSRWAELSNNDVINTHKNYQNYSKGYYFTSNIAPQKNGWNHMLPNNKAKPKMTEDTEKYFKMTIDYCKKHNIELIMLGLPDKRSWKYNDSVAMNEYAKKYNVTFLDLNNSSYDFNWKTDISDKIGVHANIYGTEKITKVIGKYLDENYNLTDHRNDKAYSGWNIDLKKYQTKRQNAYKQLEERNNNEDNSQKNKK